MKVTRLVLCIVLGVVALLFLASTVSAHTTVMGVDLGSEFIKVCAAKKDHTIDIVLNEQTRRKSNHYVGFRGDDRYFGEDARNLAARFPQNMFAMLNRLAGLSLDRPEDAEQLKFYQNEMQFPFVLSNDSKRGSINLSIPKNPNVTHSVEEMLAMMFSHLKEITVKDTEAPAGGDCQAVVTVPHFFNTRQRQAIVDAASLAGVEILATMHPVTATAMYFGMQQQGFGEERKHVVIFDIGSTKTEVGVFTFGPKPPLAAGEKRVKLAHSLGTLTTRAIASDSTLGGRTFDACLSKELVRQFSAKYPKLPVPLNGTTVAQFKSAFSLFRAASNLKEQLSANSIAPVNVEGIAPDKDFNTKMSREEFENLCEPLFDRAVAVAKKAIEQSGLTIDDITRFELMGGGSRLPKLINELSDYYGKAVDRTLNTDEAAAMGVAYYAASHSGFRVRSFKLLDHYPYDFDFVMSPKPRPATEDPETPKARPPAPRQLFVNELPGSRKSITIKRDDDFSFVLRNCEGKCRHAEIAITGVRNALDALDALNPVIPHENNTYRVRVEVKLNRAGTISVPDAEVKVVYAANVSKRVKVALNETEDESNATSTDAEATDKAEGASEPSAQDDANATATGEETATDAAANTTAEGNATTAPKKKKFQWSTVYKIVIKRKTRPLVAKVTYLDLPLPLDSEDFAAGGAVLAGYDLADENKRLLAAAKNDFETYIQFVKGDGILDNPELVELNLINDTQKERIGKVAAEAQEWLEDGEGSYDSTPREEYEERLIQLKNATSDVTGPYDEHKAKLVEAQRNATNARRKAAEDAAKAAKKAAREAKKKAEKAAKATAEETQTEEGSEDKKEEGSQKQEGEEEGQKSEEPESEKESSKSKEEDL